MKKIGFLVFIIIYLFGYMSCKKDDGTVVFSGRLPDKVNTPPKVDAGYEVYLVSPTSETTLTGSYSDAERNVRELKWTKISGPDSYRLADQNSLSTRLDQLVKGVYQFELKVTDNLGLSGKDTIKVTVVEISSSPNEIIFIDRPWTSPWYNTIEIPNFTALIPPNTTYLVYIRRDFSPNWILVTPFSQNSSELYDYFVETRSDEGGIYHSGSLYIDYYEMDVSDRPDVKIVY